VREDVLPASGYALCNRGCSDLWLVWSVDSQRRNYPNQLPMGWENVALVLGRLVMSPSLPLVTQEMRMGAWEWAGYECPSKVDWVSVCNWLQPSAARGSRSGKGAALAGRCSCCGFLAVAS